MRQFIPGDSYRTAPDAPRALSNRLLFGWRWALYLEYFGIVLRSRAAAVQGIYDDEQWAQSSIDVLRVIERHRGRLEIAGLEHLRAAAATPPYVLIGNHMSTLETQVLPVLVVQHMPVTFVVKESLTTNPFFGPVMRSRNPIAVRRKNPREDLEAVLTQGRALLEGGTSLIIFPQSTRTPTFSREAFNSLGIKLALQAGVPVIPFAVKTDFWGEKGLFRGFGKIRPDRTIHIEFGAPMHVAGRGKAEHTAVMDFIESRLAAWAIADAATPSATPPD